MITNNGQELIAKYLLGQAPQYATHISIGCGAIPLDNNDVISPEKISEIKNKEAMDFEMARLPIVSKGMIEENNLVKIAFTAELPTENRYDITEIGLWSAGRNNLAINSDSKIIFNFAEPWEKRTSSAIETIPFLQTIGINGDILTEEKIFATDTNNNILRNFDRTSRKEGPRYLNNTILLRGDSSKINSYHVPISSSSVQTQFDGSRRIVYQANNTFAVNDIVTIAGFSDENFNKNSAVIVDRTSTSFSIETTLPAGAGPSGGVAWIRGAWEAAEEVSTGVQSQYIYLNNASLGINSNSPIDELKLASSLVYKTAISGASFSGFVKILVEFYKNEVASNYSAKSEILLNTTDFLLGYYNVTNIPISNLITTADFNASQIRTCKIFVSIVDSTDSVLNDEYYMALDGFRLDNISTVNPLCKMVGYSIVKLDGTPIVKYQNTNNYIEFRMAIGLTT